MNIEYKIGLVCDDGFEWANIEIDKNTALIGVYEEGKIERKFIIINREQARQLAKVLGAFAHEML